MNALGALLVPGAVLWNHCLRHISCGFAIHKFQTQANSSNNAMLTTQDKHNLCCQKVASLLVSLAQGVDLGKSGYGI